MWLSKSARYLNNAVTPVNKTANNLGLISLALMTLLMIVDVVTRYVFTLGVPGAYELVEFAMAVIVGFGLAYTAICGEHITVDFVTSRFSQRTQAVINSTTSFLELGLFCLITWQVIVNAEKLRASAITSPILSIPVYPFVYLVAFGTIMLCLVFLKNLLNHLDKALEGVNWRVRSALLLLMALIVIILVSPLWGKELLWEMNSLVAGFFGIGMLVVLLFSGMSVGNALGLAGFLGFVYLSNFGAALTTIGLAPYRIASNYSFSVIPLFTVMGLLCFHSGLSRELYAAAYKWLGHLPGGLAMATIGACAGFAAITGSSIATVATLGVVALPEMRKYRYDSSLAAGSIAAGGCLGILIPPSLFLAVYGIITEQSIGKLFLAGFLPGILQAIFYIITIYILCKRNPSLGPKGENFTITEKFTSLKGTWGVLLLFVLVIGGLYLGIFTPTEAAGVGAFGAFVFALGRRKLTWNNFVDSLVETGKTTGMVFLILIGAEILGYFLTITRLPFELAKYVTVLNVHPLIVFIAILVVYLFLGCIMSGMAMLVITVPIFFPIIVSLGFNPIWFGIMVVRLVEIGQLTPPVGMNVYVMHGIAKDIPMHTIFKGIVPFLIADMLNVALLIAFPQIALIVPNLMR